MPFFKKHQGDYREIPDHIRRRYIKELDEGVMAAKFGAWLRLKTIIQERYGQGEDWTSALCAAVLDTLFGNRLVKQAEFASHYSDYIVTFAHAIKDYPEIADMLGMAVREYILPYGGLVSQLDDGTKAQWLQSKGIDYDTGTVVVNALEAIQTYQLPQFGEIESPGTFAKRAFKCANAVQKGQ